MKTVIDYLKVYGKYEQDIRDIEFSLNLVRDYLVLDCKDKRWWWQVESHRDTEDKIMDILGKEGIEIRFCEECGSPYNMGYTTDGGFWYCCEDCFERVMDKDYGKGKWRASEEVGEWEGWYEALNEDGEWEDTGIYYTEWY